MKKIVIGTGIVGVFLAPVLFILLIFLCLSGDFEENGSNSSVNGGYDIVQVAMAEVKPENNGGRKFWTFMDWADRDEWCAAFVSWCADQCGYIESGIIPKSGWCNDFRVFYKSKELWEDGQAHGGNYTPKAGDLILFQWQGNTSADLDHIGIVEKCEDDTVYTVEGNSGDAVRRKSYAVSNRAIIGYCKPEYPSGSSVGGLIGATNAEKVYRAFVRAGYSKAAAAAIVGNLAGEGGVDSATNDIKIGTTEIGSGNGIGMCQWSDGRKTAFMAFAQSKGDPWPGTGLATQLDFMMQELETTQWIWSGIGEEYGSQHNISLDEFKKCTDVDFATTVFCAKFERCHKYNSHLDDTRKPYARRVLNSFG